jgi:hypothetical protein
VYAIKNRNRFFNKHSSTMIEINVPQSAEQWEKYYDLRFKILREPWGQPKGSEVLKDEDEATHAMAVDTESGQILGVARLQKNSPTEDKCVVWRSQTKHKAKVLVSF